MSGKRPYQSTLWIVTHSAEEVVYADGEGGPVIARVYIKDGEWYLATSLLSHWQPVPAPSKYEAFLLLLNLKKQHEH